VLRAVGVVLALDAAQVEAHVPELARVPRGAVGVGLADRVAPDLAAREVHDGDDDGGQGPEQSAPHGAGTIHEISEACVRLRR
jgi:hypothetical protein